MISTPNAPIIPPLSVPYGISAIFQDRNLVVNIPIKKEKAIIRTIFYP